jgi:hypothetical protein
MDSPSARKILAHRGLWKDELDLESLPMNSLEAINRAVELGFGFETDLRDFQGDIAISHDPVLTMGNSFAELLRFDLDGLVAFNIKSDGIAPMINSEIKIAKPKFEYFFFDMSIPEMQRYARHDLPLADRMSEIEVFSVSNRGYVWLDSFTTEWYVNDSEWRFLLENKKIIVVSPELHGRPYLQSWKWIANQMNLHSNLYLCTDYPLQFLNYWESIS